MDNIEEILLEVLKAISILKWDLIVKLRMKLKSLLKNMEHTSLERKMFISRNSK